MLLSLFMFFNLITAIMCSKFYIKNYALAMATVGIEASSGLLRTNVPRRNESNEKSYSFTTIFNAIHLSLFLAFEYIISTSSCCCIVSTACLSIKLLLLYILQMISNAPKQVIIYLWCLFLCVRVCVCSEHTSMLSINTPSAFTLNLLMH